MFAEGESLAAAQLTRAGAFPWRDLLTIHGPLLDIFRPLVGLELYGDTRWAATTGWLLIVIPLQWIALYALCAYLFRRNWLFLIGSQVAVVTGAVFTIDVRFLFMPVLLLLLIALLRKATWTRAAAFVAAPDRADHRLAGGGHRGRRADRDPGRLRVLLSRPARSLAENFRRTLLCASSGAAFVAAWLVFLAAFSALGSFVFYYRTFAPGHQLTGGFPIEGSWMRSGCRMRVHLCSGTPVVLAVLAFCFFAIRIRFRLPLRVEDWAMGGAALFMALYYTKFLSRPDHVFESFGVAVPVLFYAVYRAIELLAARMPPRLSARGPMR